MENLDYQSTIYELFSRQVKTRANNVAIINNNRIITYAEFSLLVDKFASVLLKNNLTNDSTVAILLAPSYQFLVAMFACLKTGIAYIPLNTNYPSNYIKKILHDAKVKTIISELPFFNAIKEFNLIDFSEIETVSLLNNTSTIIQPSSQNNAYIIYTSGSTGSPKGVPITHEAVISLLTATQPIYKINSNDIIPLFHSVGFDFSIWEICLTLLHGASLIIVPEQSRQSLEHYCDFLIQYGVSIVNITPSLLYLLQNILIKKSLGPGEKLKLRLIISGGEALDPSRMRKWFASPISKKINLYNMYGITEGTIHSTIKHVISNDSLSDISPIGVPLAHVETAIIDEHHKLVTKDMIGELCLAGISVTKGYLNAPNLNNENFFSASFDNKKEKRYFKTGDLVQTLSNGELKYIERKNKILKIRGFRVNLHEINNQISQLPNVENVLTSTFSTNDGDERLVTYIQGNHELLDIVSIKKHLAENLPDFMCPTKFVVVKKFPITINGKIDLKKLDENLSCPSETRLSETKSLTIEDLIKQAWQQVLNRNTIDIEENFFDAGGDSLMLLKLQFVLQENLKRDVAIIDLIEFPSIKKLSSFIKSRDTTDNAL